MIALKPRLESVEIIKTLDDVTELRRCILFLGISGRLTIQKDRGDSVDSLVEKFDAAKIAKKNKSQSTSEGEVKGFFEIPSSWRWLTLQSVGKIVGGGTPPSGDDSNFTTSGKGFGWLTPADMKNLTSLFVTSGERDLTKKGLESSSAQLMPAGTVLFSSRAPIGYVAIAAKEISTNQGFKSCIPFVSETSEFIYWYLKWAGKIIDERASGTTFKEVSGKIVNQVPIPIPPLSEQLLIVEQLKKFMSLCDSLEQSLIKYDQTNPAILNKILKTILEAMSPENLKESLEKLILDFDQLIDSKFAIDELSRAIIELCVRGEFTRKVKFTYDARALIQEVQKERSQLIAKKLLKWKPEIENSKNLFGFEIDNCWTWVKLNEISFITKLAGFEYTEYLRPLDDGEIPLVRAQNVKSNGLIEKNLKYIDLKTSLKLERSALVKPCLLITFIGAGIGDVAIFNKKERWHLAPNVGKIEPFNNFEEKIDIEFLHFYLISPSGRQQIFKHIKSTAQPSISMSTIRDIDVPLPPLEIQKEIVRATKKFLETIANLRGQQEKLQKISERAVKSCFATPF